MNYDELFKKKPIEIEDKNGNIIIRWDNAPHYKNIKTVPHHKHTKNGVEESDEVCLEDVLKYIENYLKKC